MINIQTEVYIAGKSPQEIYNWWLGLDDKKYKSWHGAHKGWRYLKDKRVKFKEKIGNYNISFWGRIVELKENEKIKFKHSYLPVVVTFKFKEKDNGTVFNYSLEVGYKGLSGKFLDKIIKLFYLKDDFKDALIKHVKEENKLLEKLN